MLDKAKIALEKTKTFAKENPKKTWGALGLGLVLLTVGGFALFYEKPIPISEKKPYSVRIESYRTTKDADYAVDRLDSLGVDSYVVRRMGKQNDIWLDVHSGAFDKKADATAFLKALKEKGLRESKVVAFKDIQKTIDAYKKAPSAERREYRLPSASIPKLSKHILSSLKHFPIDKNYKIITVKFADSKTAPQSSLWRHFSFDYDYVPKGNTISKMMQNTDAVAQAVYEDKLLRKRAGIIILACNDAKQTRENIQLVGEPKWGEKIASDLKFNTTHGVLEGNLYEKKNKKATTLVFVGSFSKTNHVLTLVSHNLSREVFDKLLAAESDDTGLLVYPEVRYNLSILPRDESGSVFTHFDLSRVGWSYAKQKGNAWWARNMVHHWNATGYFMKNDKPFSISFFNLNYGATADKIHQNFMSEKKKAKNTYSRELFKLMGVSPGWASKVREGTSGWYLPKGSSSMNELSFALGSVVVSLDSYRQKVGEKEMKAIANDLQIW
ncbi:MAG TPA: SPOR domain-containing protein [Turneriella sp.]|nr:SPOR domain-containing protein [Turneriella sp.]